MNAGLVKQNEQRCEQEIEDIKRGVKCGNITPDTSLIRFSDEALDEQKHSIRIADEKVALAVQAYDLVCLSVFVTFLSLYLLTDCVGDFELRHTPLYFNDQDINFLLRMIQVNIRKQ